MHGLLAMTKRWMACVLLLSLPASCGGGEGAGGGCPFLNGISAGGDPCTSDQEGMLCKTEPGASTAMSYPDTVKCVDGTWVYEDCKEKPSFGICGSWPSDLRCASQNGETLCTATCSTDPPFQYTRSVTCRDGKWADF